MRGRVAYIHPLVYVGLHSILSCFGVSSAIGNLFTLLS